MEDSNSLISIIVPCYNYGVFLSECLDSILAQTHNNWECIIADNCSTDNTKEVANRYVQKDPRFTYLFCEKKGVSAARNKAIRHSKGHYILPLDADDKIAASYLQKALHILDERPTVKIVYCKAKLFGQTSKNWGLPPFSLRKQLQQNVIFSSALYRKKDYDQTTGYDETFLQGFEDWDFWLTMLQSGGDVYCLDERLFFYRIRSTSRNHSLSNSVQRELRQKIYGKHKDLYEKEFNLGDVLFENYLLETNYKQLLNSGAYKLLLVLLRPVQLVKKLFKNKE